MPLPTGTRLGPYEIVSPIGAGGMGEVYRARDTRLDRTVAIKVLPSHLSSDPARRERFQREARTVSSLSHPHICSLYDIGHQDGIDYLVMEYLEGETLDHRLTKGPLPTDQVLRYATEIADALDKAHRQGVIHRDLKPANVMLTKSGAKLLDFGLAKLRGPEGAFVGLSALPTENRSLTAEGTILGTLQYMAPEQLEGKEADARTDIFAFGVVLYEMATARKAFEGKSQASLIGAILHKEPPAISSLQPMTPPALDRVVKTCMAKDPDDRWQSARDLANELKWIVEGGSQAGIPAPVVARRKSRERLAWSLAGLMTTIAVVATLAFAVFYFKSASSDVRAIRSFIFPPEKSLFHSVGPTAGPVTVSPDGQRLAFVALTEGKRQLWVRSLDALTGQPLRAAEDASFPFWSPDSRYIGFFADGKLKKIEASGGPPQTLCDAPAGRGGSWNRDGFIVFAPRVQGPIYRVSAAGGAATAITKPDESRRETSHRWPYFLPDGRHFLYLAGAGPSGEGNIYMASLDSKENKVLLSAASNVEYAQGHLLFVRETTLMAQPFNAKRLEITGDAFPIAEQVPPDDTFKAVFSASENGILAYQSGAGQWGTQPLWFDRAGKQVGAIKELGIYYSPRLSPDGRKLALQILDPQTRNFDIWLYELSRGLRTRFTFDPSIDTLPIWSPDGRRIVFASNRKGAYDLYQKASDSSGSEEMLLQSDSPKFPTDWSSDGRFIAYFAADPKGKTKNDLWILPLSEPQPSEKGRFEARKPFPFLQTEFWESGGNFSPNGRWIAYHSDESTKYEIYVAPFPGPGGKRQISTGGGKLPRWRRDGKELFYLSADNKIMAAEVKTEGPTLEVGAVRPLFETRPQRGPSFIYDVSADGQRFLINTVVTERVAHYPGGKLDGGAEAVIQMRNVEFGMRNAN